MTIYSGPFADLYDLIYRDKPYEAESKAVAAILTSHDVKPPGQLLDVACGTGKHAMHFHDLGWKVTGVDASEDMLERAKDTAKHTGRDVIFALQDMRGLSLDRTFDAAVCLFDSIGYAITNEGVIRTLKAVRDHLAPRGVFVFEMWHAAAMLRGHDPVRVRRIETEEGREIVRISETTVDTVSSTATVQFTFFEPAGDRGYSRYEESHRNRFFSVPEMEALLDAAGLEPLRWYPGFTEDGEINQDTWHVVGAGLRR